MEQRNATATAARALQILVWVTVAALVSLLISAWLLTRVISSSLRAAIATLNTAIADVLAAAAQQASGTAEEAAAVQQTSTTVEELNQTVQVATKKAHDVVDASQKTDQVSESGQQAVAEAIQLMQ
jgi:methyl-accepting chemotaxis protein